MKKLGNEARLGALKGELLNPKSIETDKGSVL